MDALIGQQLGRYTIEEQLGQGGMAAVFRASDPNMARQVAIKVLPREFASDPTYLERFRREVRTIARLNHPSIVPVHDFGEDRGWTYIVMTYVPGGTLHTLIRKMGNKIPFDLIETYFEQIGSALDYAHSQGVIHRDFKPGNVLIRDDRHVLLSDFGVAKVSEVDSKLTGTGMMVGTPLYIAPEMASQNEITPLVDVYAAGITLYEMVTGAAPFEADTPMGMMMQHLSHTAPEARILRPDVPAGLQSVIEKGIAKDPAQRYQSAGAMAADLKAALAGGGAAVGMPSLPAQMDSDNLYAVRNPGPTPTPSAQVISAPAKPSKGGSGLVWAAGGLVGALLLVGIIVAVTVVGALIIGGGTMTINFTSSPVPPTQASLPDRPKITIANRDSDGAMSDLTDYEPMPDFGTHSFSGNITEDRPAVWLHGWCTKTKDQLVDNWDKMRFEFSMNGVEIPLSEFGDTGIEEGIDVENHESFCRSYFVTLSDWPPGETVLTQSITILSNLNDGFYDYEPGTWTDEFHIFMEE